MPITYIILIKIGHKFNSTYNNQKKMLIKIISKVGKVSSLVIEEESL